MVGGGKFFHILADFLSNDSLVILKYQLADTTPVKNELILLTAYYMPSTVKSFINTIYLNPPNNRVCHILIIIKNHNM